MNKLSPRLREMRKRIMNVVQAKAHEDVTELELEQLADAILAELLEFLYPGLEPSMEVGP